ncbi:MAG: CAP domain-containing protein [Candidatus Promineifilaceae bacterium]
MNAAPNFEFIFADYTNAGQRVAGTTKSEKTSTEFLWDMGDGRHYSGAEISHRYWRPGDYIVTVTARNEFGETRVSKWIRVGFDLAYYFMPFISSGGFVDSTLESLSLINPVDGAINIGLGEVPELNPIDFAPGATTAERLFIYINEARRLYNLRPLTYVHSLSVAAQAHTDDMAANGYTAHIGSDGSTPAYRIQQAGYRGGYGGEATAWGMSDPIEPVRFWLTSPSHRAIILNPAASEVGIGFTTNFESPNVWYWTAEFASIDLPVVNASAPQAPEPEEVLELALLGPPQASEFALNDNAQLIFSWSWAGGIQDHQRFALYLNDGGRTFQAGVIRGSQASGQYHFAANASSMAIAPGPYSWQVKLEDSAQGIVLEESPIWRVTFTNSNEGVADVSPTPIPSEPLPSPTPEAPPEQPPSQNPLLIATPVPPTAP